MSGGEGDRFVVEVQERVVMRLPLLMPAASELERAGDPEVACVEADDLAAGVEDAAVARPRAPERDRFDVTQSALHDYGPASLCRVGCKGRLKPIEEGNLRCLQPSACLVEIEPFDAVDLGECLDGA